MAVEVEEVGVEEVEEIAVIVEEEEVKVRIRLLRVKPRDKLKVKLSPGEAPSILIFLQANGKGVGFIINTDEMRTFVLNQRLVHGKMCMFQDNENLTSSVKIQTFIHFTKTTNFKK